MHVIVAENLIPEPQKRQATSIIRRCVHCGLCNATCPTYQLLGDEADGPRGRIYQIKQALEDGVVGQELSLHLDRCLTCRNCETTCPSGVEYANLVDIGRQLVQDKGPKRPLKHRIIRYLLLRFLPYPKRLKPFLRIGQWFRPLFPKSISRSIPAKDATQPMRQTQSSQRVILPQGCIQRLSKTNTNEACQRILSRLGVEVVATNDGCCGAIAHHLSDQESAQATARNNMMAWCSALDAGAECIIMTASGCGSMVKDYDALFDQDVAMAKRVVEKTRDFSEWLTPEAVKKRLKKDLKPLKIVFHPPCTLQHGQKIVGKVEALLQACGCELLPFADSHLCCGSAGTYSIFQPEISKKLIEQKVKHLESQSPELIVTANIGCQLYIESHSTYPVRHWIEVLDQRMA